MSWQIRHQGSPRSVPGLSLAEVIEGLQDGYWEPTDEVMGPDDSDWETIENHPALAEIAADLEPPPPKLHEDETRLDMNPLIDVALVLLIFFILTTSYAALQKVIDMPVNSAKKVDSPLRVVPQALVKELMVKVEARMKDGEKVIKVEDEVVDERHLRSVLNRFVKGSRRTNLLIDAKGVDLGTVVTIQDAAKGAGFEMVYLLTEQPAPTKPPVKEP
jgi:biopolymer transport protein ExbD